MNLGGSIIEDMVNNNKSNHWMSVKFCMLKITHDPFFLEGVPQIIAQPHVWVCRAISGFDPNPDFSELPQEGTQNNPCTLP